MQHLTPKEAYDFLQANPEAVLKDVYNVAHGFEGDLDETHHRNSHNGWRFDGLSWAQT